MLLFFVSVSDSLSNISLFMLMDPHSQIDNKFCPSCSSNQKLSLDCNFSVLGREFFIFGNTGMLMKHGWVFEVKMFLRVGFEAKMFLNGWVWKQNVLYR